MAICTGYQDKAALKETSLLGSTASPKKGALEGKNYEPIDESNLEKWVKVVIYSLTDHAEIVLDEDQMLYYVGPKNRNNGHMSLKKAIEFSNRSPIVVISFPVDSSRLKEVVADLKEKPVSYINTCMGSASELLSRLGHRVPPVIRQIPSLASLYFIGLNKLKLGSHQVETHGALERKIATDQAKHVLFYFAFLFLILSPVLEKAFNLL